MGANPTASARTPTPEANWPMPKSALTTSCSNANGPIATAMANPRAAGTRNSSVPAPPTSPADDAAAVPANDARATTHPPTAQPERQDRPVSRGTSAATMTPQPNHPTCTGPTPPVMISAAEGTAARLSQRPVKDAASPRLTDSTSHGSCSGTLSRSPPNAAAGSLTARARSPPTSGAIANSDTAAASNSDPSGLTQPTAPRISALPARWRHIGSDGRPGSLNGATWAWRAILRNNHGAAA